MKRLGTKQNQSPFALAALVSVLTCVACLQVVSASVDDLKGSPSKEAGKSAGSNVDNQDIADGLAVDRTEQTHWRIPIDLVCDSTGNWLATGNRQSATVSIVSTQDATDRAELTVGKALSDLHYVPSRDWLLVADPKTHQVRCFEWKELTLSHVDSVAVSPYPSAIAATSDGERMAVSSLWSRRVAIYHISTETDHAPEFNRTWQLDLSFAPREVQFMQEDRLLVVADAFGGKLALIDAKSGELLREREIPAHKIRGLGSTLDGERLIVSHQMLNSLAHTIRNDVHWGLLMSNDLRWLNLEVLLSHDQDFYKESHMHPIGQAGSGMGDPAGIAMSSQGTVAVAIAGVDRVVVGQEEDFSLRTINVGRGPTAVVFDPTGERLYVCNRYDDTISEIDVAEKKVVREISLGQTPEPSNLLVGDRLFHNAKLAHDGWMSCASCHVDGHTNGQLNDNLSDKSFGAPKRVLSLLGKANTEPLAWNGSRADVPEQIRASIKQTMQGPRELNDKQVAALTEFVNSLPAPPSLDEARGEIDAPSVQRGEAMFSKLECNKCHQPPLYTTPELYDVGLVDEEDNHEFNPPSLIGLSQRGPYFHDNRAADLTAVFREYEHQLTLELSDEELADLIAFLRSL